MRRLNLLFCMLLFLLPLDVAVGQSGSYEFPKLPIAELEHRFVAAVADFQARRWGEGGEKLQELKARAVEFGFLELSDFALRLQKLAALMVADESIENTAFLIRESVRLAPTHSGVLLAATRYSNIIGKPQALSYLGQALWHAPKTATVTYSILLSAVMIGLAATTLALFFVILVQLAVGMPDILRMLTEGTRRFGGALVSPILALSLLLLPLVAGFLVCLAVWSYLVSRTRVESRSLIFITGVVTLCWGLSLPIFEAVMNQIESTAGEATENAFNRTLGPDRTALLEVAAAAAPKKPVRQYLVGSELLRRGRYDYGRRLVEEASLLADALSKNEVAAASLNQLAVLELSRKNASAAVLLLEKGLEKDPESFALNYNLSLAYLAVVDPEKQRSRLQKAREIDSGRLEELESRPLGTYRYAHYQLPLSSLYYFFVTPAPWLAQPRASIRSVRLVNIYQMLVRDSESSLPILVLGVLCIVLGLLFIPKADPHDQLSEAPSRVWLLIPGGIFFAGQYPVKGLMFLGLFFACVMFFVGEPTVVYTSMVGAFQSQAVFAGLAGFVMLLYVISGMQVRSAKQAGVG